MSLPWLVSAVKALYFHIVLYVLRLIMSNNTGIELVLEKLMYINTCAMSSKLIILSLNQSSHKLKS